MNACIGLEPVIVNLFFTIFPQSLAILITGILLSTVIPYFGMVLWVWGIAIIIYTYQSAKVGQIKASTFADACSVFNGHIVDVIGNVQSVIHNATFGQETRLLNQNMNDLIDKERLRNRHANKSHVFATSCNECARCILSYWFHYWIQKPFSKYW
ncbi:multidrug resistance ABC transporter ATP-binding protein [Legionella santicrucis]|uniref:Multidrug resistance ABC transporter ATP-binding protein n=1 Tax=Legionella santicrucis TaxID=45074 RepID=A0A0W0YA32_9GAMM|nr:hypothetical protein [Legionella santicrucis]KTD53738.1 multidrug resistance ABC transporter ATP-binding protein [Legionella santicrucis]